MAKEFWNHKSWYDIYHNSNVSQPVPVLHPINMDTYKHRAPGDYMEAIRTYGTCNS